MERCFSKWMYMFISNIFTYLCVALQCLQSFTLLEMRISYSLVLGSLISWFHRVGSSPKLRHSEKLKRIDSHKKRRSILESAVQFSCLPINSNSALATMSRFLCCCLQDGDEKKVTDGDYLLPGGDWDPSLSSSPLAVRTDSRRQSPSESSARHLSYNTSSSVRSFLTRRWRGKKSSRYSQTPQPDGDGGRGEYQPPPLVPSKTLPTFDEFKLLKTVGKGAFGKVCCTYLCIHIS